jgi:hypothetical protein
MGVALMAAIFDAPNAKKVPVRDFDAKRVISLHGNEDVAERARRSAPQTRLVRSSTRHLACGLFFGATRFVRRTPRSPVGAALLIRKHS